MKSMCKKFMSFVVVALLVLTSLPTTALANGLARGPESPVVETVRGSVFVERAGGHNRTAVYRGMHIYDGDVIITGLNSTATITYYGQMLILGELTTLSLNSIWQRHGRNNSSISLVEGMVKVRVDVSLDDNSSNMAQAAGTLVGVRGTKYILTYRRMLFGEEGEGMGNPFLRMMVIDGEIVIDMPDPEGTGEAASFLVTPLGMQRLQEDLTGRTTLDDIVAVPDSFMIPLESLDLTILEAIINDPQAMAMNPELFARIEEAIEFRIEEDARRLAGLEERPAPQIISVSEADDVLPTLTPPGEEVEAPPVVEPEPVEEAPPVVEEPVAEPPAQEPPVQQAETPVVQETPPVQEAPVQEPPVQEAPVQEPPAADPPQDPPVQQDPPPPPADPPQDPPQQTDPPVQEPDPAPVDPPVDPPADPPPVDPPPVDPPPVDPPVDPPVQPPPLDPPTDPPVDPPPLDPPVDPPVDPPPLDPPVDPPTEPIITPPTDPIVPPPPPPPPTCPTDCGCDGDGSCGDHCNCVAPPPPPPPPPSCPTGCTCEGVGCGTGDCTCEPPPVTCPTGCTCNGSGTCNGVDCDCQPPVTCPTDCTCGGDEACGGEDCTCPVLCPGLNCGCNGTGSCNGEDCACLPDCTNACACNGNPGAMCNNNCSCPTFLVMDITREIGDTLIPFFTGQADAQGGYDNFVEYLLYITGFDDLEDVEDLELAIDAPIGILAVEVDRAISEADGILITLLVRYEAPDTAFPAGEFVLEIDLDEIGDYLFDPEEITVPVRDGQAADVATRAIPLMQDTIVLWNNLLTVGRLPSDPQPPVNLEHSQPADQGTVVMRSLHYVLTEDIDLADTGRTVTHWLNVANDDYPNGSWNWIPGSTNTIADRHWTQNINVNTNNWTAIHQFTGSFDGAGHTVENLRLSAGVTNHLRIPNNVGAQSAANPTALPTAGMGFFSQISPSGVVRNVGFKDAQVYRLAGNTHGNSGLAAGVIAGANNGLIESVFVVGDNGHFIALTTRRYFGGVVGINNGIINQAFVSATLSGEGNNFHVGGVAGVGAGTITNSVVVSDMLRTGTTAGSIVGRIRGSAGIPSGYNSPQQGLEGRNFAAIASGIGWWNSQSNPNNANMTMRTPVENSIQDGATITDYNIHEVLAILANIPGLPAQTIVPQFLALDLEIDEDLLAQLAPDSENDCGEDDEDCTCDDDEADTEDEEAEAEVDAEDETEGDDLDEEADDQTYPPDYKENDDDDLEADEDPDKKENDTPEDEDYYYNADDPTDDDNDDLKDNDDHYTTPPQYPDDEYYTKEDDDDYYYPTHPDDNTHYTPDQNDPTNNEQINNDQTQPYPQHHSYKITYYKQ